MNTILIIGMVIACIGMIVSLKYLKSLAVIFLLILCICGGIYLVNSGVFGSKTNIFSFGWMKPIKSSFSSLFSGLSPEMKEALSSYERFTEASAQAAGEFVSRNFKGQKAVIVAAGGSAFEKQPNKLADYVRKHINGVDVVVKGLPYTPTGNDPGMGDEFLKAKYFNQLFNENKDVKVFILTISLPFDPAETANLNIWKKKGAQKLVIINADIQFLGKEIENGNVAAAIVMRPDLKQSDYEKNAPHDLKKAFEARYLLVTQENLRDIAKKYPSLFR